ncbi:unnamed protein product [Rotaria sordida]|uniref:CUB domain-containing protein n=1 Tax=Rotaria sordida TaxID=392033 RepID=A0A818QA27_9BILA|nr:unnamed protein product [Rotaria sordida]CAF0772458.1 unnamed protein product [Rotaria sordida]CAF0774154.1 unnamed protein product [Rotaria sordida]CAF0782470.1 unnamed protein product [Rotaria sordida]CAF0816644.1 unnamed protein product [Rotaria sordida]
MPSMVVMRATHSMYGSPHMDKQCDKTITLDGDTLPGTYFSLTSNKYKQNFNCILTIKGSTVSQRIIIVIDRMDIACGGDKLLIYDGHRDPKSLLNLDEKFQCGTKQYYLRTPSTNTVIIEFISNNDGKVGNGFVLNVAINFPVSTCSRIDNLYRCKNLYCISNIFNCDDRNWCGDNTQKFVC